MGTSTKVVVTVKRRLTGKLVSLSEDLITETPCVVVCGSWALKDLHKIKRGAHND